MAILVNFLFSMKLEMIWWKTCYMADNRTAGGLYEVWMRDYSLNSPTKDARVSPIWVDRETIPMVLTINAEFSQKWDEWGEDKEISYTLQYPKLFGDESEHTLTTYHANDSCFQIVLDGQTYQPDSTGVFRIVWSGAGK